MTIEQTVSELVEFYGESRVLPTRAQWHQLVSSEHEGSICMVNFMKFREVAAYQQGEGGDAAAVSGMEAMMRYFETGHKKVTEVGGEFIANGLFGGIMIGEDEDWDALGVVRYPNPQAFLKVFSDEEYRRNHYHRMAGTLRHRMAILLDV